MISVTGRVQETGQEVYIKFIDYDINTAVYSKADLLKAVQHQLSSSRFTRQFQVVDFDKDARVTNRYGDLYIAGTDGSVNFGKDEVQQYLLSGHVILKKAEKEIDPEVVKPATDVAVHYNVNFESYEDGRKYNYSLDLD
ncbi:staphylokinase domain-containing protein, partial [Streptococcus pyogenes]